MNARIKQIVLVVTSFVLAIAILLLALVVLKYFVGLLLSIDKQVAASIIAASATLLAAVGVALYSQRRIKKREVAEAHRPQKIEVYSQFMQTIVQVFLRSKDTGADNSTEGFVKEFEEFFMSFTKGLIVWGSPGVIRAWQTFRRTSSSGATVLPLVDDILREIRRDLGNSNWGLQRGDLIKLFLKDPEELERMLTSKKS